VSGHGLGTTYKAVNKKRYCSCPQLFEGHEKQMAKTKPLISIHTLKLVNSWFYEYTFIKIRYHPKCFILSKPPLPQITLLVPENGFLMTDNDD